MRKIVKKVRGFSFTDTRPKHDFTLLCLTMAYSSSNAGLYFESLNEFPLHYGLIDHPLTQFNKDNSLEVATLTVLSLSTIILGYSNQVGYTHHIEKILPKPILPRHSWIKAKGNNRPKRSNAMVIAELTAAIISGLYKTTVASTSFLALSKNFMGSKWAIITSALFAPGNFMAQFAVLIAPLVKDHHLLQLSNRLCWLLAHSSTLFYNAVNCALYFNSGDDFLHRINILDHRLTEGSALWELLLVGGLILSSVFLFISTQRSYSKKVANVFQKHGQKPILTQSENKFNDKYLNKLAPFFLFESAYTTLYKSFINYISLVASVFDLLPLFSIPTNLSLLFILCSPAILGNLYAQFAVLQPDPSSEQALKNRLLLQKTPCFFGLFYQWQRQQPGVLGPAKSTNSSLIKP